METTTDLRFTAFRKPLPKGSVDGFPVTRAACQVCTPARSCAAACGACDQCRPATACGKSNCYGGKIVGVIITDGGGKELKAWQNFVGVHASSARDVAKWRVLEKPAAIEVWLAFLLARPESHLTDRGGYTLDGLRHPVPVAKPDWDKLSRAACDALTGVIVADDSQIVAAHVAKAYTLGRPGLLVRIRQVTREPDWVIDELRAAGLETPVVQGTLL